MKKTLYVIILIVIIVILLLFKFSNSNNTSCDNINNGVKQSNNMVYEVKNNNEILSSEEKIVDNLSATKETIINYEKSQSTIVAKVNDYEISEKDLYITKYFYSDSNDLLKQEIENVVLFNLAKENDLTINTEEQQYINDVVEGLKEDISNSDIFKEKDISVDEYLQLIKKYMERITLISEYKSLTSDKIKEGTLEIEDEDLEKEYKDYYKAYTEWKENKDIGEYKKISDFKDEILKKYIEYQVNQAEVIIY